MTDKLVRLYSIAGPCLVQGRLTAETPKFYCFEEWLGRNAEGELVYAGAKRVAKDRAHVEPCRSCRDHAATIYPHGYMD